MELKMLEDVQTIIASLGGLAGIGLVFKELFRVWMRRREYDVEKVMQVEGQIYFHLSKIQMETGADKVVMLKLHNGGAEVRVGHPVYSSITHETHSNRMKSQIGKWKNIRLDKSYLNEILKLVSSPLGRSKAEAVNLEEGILKDAMEKHNINHTWHFHVFTHRPKPFKFLTHFKEENLSSLWYISIIFLNDNLDQTINGSERDSVRENVQAIKSLLKQAKRYD